jgi:hypothetical protein
VAKNATEGIVLFQQFLQLLKGRQPKAAPVQGGVEMECDSSQWADDELSPELLGRARGRMEATVGAGSPEAAQLAAFKII